MEPQACKRLTRAELDPNEFGPGRLLKSALMVAALAMSAP